MIFIKLIFIFCFCLLPSSNIRAIDKFDSDRSVLLDGYISSGKIVSDEYEDFAIGDEIELQLRFTVGQFNGLEGGTPDLEKTVIKITEKKKEGLRYVVSYEAWLKISWPIEQKIPEQYQILLPTEGSYYHLQTFLKKYGQDAEGEKKCLDWSAHDVDLGNFWYYYRPLKGSCPLKKSENEDVVKTAIHLKISDENTEGKSPEYKKVWEDSRLVATTIFAMNEAESDSEWDAGLVAYKKFVSLLLQKFGKPKWSNIENVDESFSPRKDQNIVQFKFDHAKGELDITAILVKGLRLIAADSIEEKLYSERTIDSDFISYSGHSGLGANIRKLAGMGKFKEGQYQLFFINGCDTFSYVDNILALAHQRVNPDYGQYKFLDMITNSMPSYFHRNADGNFSLLQALIEEKKTYREILREIDPQQRAVVTGEEDNEWP